MNTDPFRKETGDVVDPVDLAHAGLLDAKAPDPAVARDEEARCVLCGKPVAVNAAEMMGSGLACDVCARAGLTQPEDQRLRRRLWPWAAGVLLLLVGGGYLVWRNHAAHERAELEREYPIAATESERAVLDRNTDRWQPRQLASAVNNPPTLEKLALGGPCGRSIEGTQEFYYGDDLASIRYTLDTIVASAKRGRFREAWEEAHVLSVIDKPVLLVRQLSRRVPALDGVDRTFTPGAVSGVAYLYEPDGTLVCAGTFKAESSESVRVEFTRIGGDNSDFDGDRDHGAARSAIDRDLDAQATIAIAAALRRVN